MGYVAMDSSTTLELAVKDLTRAAQLAPGDKAVKLALKKYHADYSVQNNKDKKTYGGMFASSDGLYSKAGGMLRMSTRPTLNVPLPSGLGGY
jgi:hypothetical protein